MNIRIFEEFPKTAMNRKASNVWTAATRGPVSLFNHSTSRFVLMTRDIFDDLTSQIDPRIIHVTADTKRRN